MQVRMLSERHIGQPASDCQDALIEGAIGHALGLAAGRCIGRRDELQPHVEFGVHGTEALQTRWCLQLLAYFRRR